MKLKPGEIQAIIWENYKKTPEQRSAEELFAKGVRVIDLISMDKSKIVIPWHIFTSVQNTLGYIEYVKEKDNGI